MQNHKKLLLPPINLLQNSALFLDFDGTLVALAARPGDIIIPPTLNDLLQKLSQNLHHRIAIVSGRSVAVLRDDFNMKNITIAGSHGNEIAFADDATPPRSDALDTLIEELQSFAAQYDGLLVEPKSMGVGLHYRQAPGHEKLCQETAYAMAQKYDLKVQAGKMLFEIYSGNEDKGTAIAKLCAIAPFLNHRPIFIGDDKTDEHGFKAAMALGGAGILVGPPRLSDAIYRLDDVAAVHEWLLAAINDKG